MLLDHNKFIVKSQSRTFSAKKDFEILDFDSGARLGTAKDITGFLASLLSSAKMEVRDSGNNDAVVFSVSRSGFIFQKDQVHDAQNLLIGRFKTKKFSLSGGFHVYDKDGKHIAEIQGSMFKAEYKFMTPDRSAEMGSVSRTWGGLAKSFMTGNDTYGVTVDPAFAGNTQAKMLILGAAIALESIFKKPGKASTGSSSSGGGE